jgi:drug/metabolite transporter (DMT)-like permease
MTPVWGELAALATSVLWSGTSTFFTLGSRKVGALVVNRARLLIALALLLLTRTLLLGGPLPLDAEPSRWFWLGLSGIVGLTIGDALLFQAFVWIGARLSMLILSSVPVMSGLLAWAFLGQRLLPIHWFGIAVTVGGIAWVVLERDRSPAASTPPPHYLRGVVFGIGAAAGQAVGLVLAREGLSGDFPALSGNVIRMVCAATAIWLLAFAQRQAGPTVRRLAADRSAWALSSGASSAIYRRLASLIAIHSPTSASPAPIMALLRLPSSHRRPGVQEGSVGRRLPARPSPSPPAVLCSPPDAGLQTHLHHSRLQSSPSRNRP